jgi:RNA binding exosome subunit
VSSKPPMGYIEVRVFAHATEDPEKVLTAVRNILPEEIGKEVIFKKDNLTGHHKNPIIVFSTKLVDKKALPSALKKIGASLSTLDKEELETNIKLHLEKSNLYLRFDKQSAYLNETKFSQNDPIHLKIHFKNKTAKEIMAICREAGLLI